MMYTLHLIKSNRSPERASEKSLLETNSHLFLLFLSLLNNRSWRDRQKRMREWDVGWKKAKGFELECNLLLFLVLILKTSWKWFRQDNKTSCLRAESFLRSLKKLIMLPKLNNKQTSKKSDYQLKPKSTSVILCQRRNSLDNLFCKLERWTPTAFYDGCEKLRSYIEGRKQTLWDILR